MLNAIVLKFVLNSIEHYCIEINSCSVFLEHHVVEKLFWGCNLQFI